jgi:agmatinase
MNQAFDPSGPATHDGIYGLPHSASEAAVVLLPVPWEPTTSYRKGTAGGPAAVLEASRQVDLFDLDFGRVYDGGIAMLEPCREIVRLNKKAVKLAQPVIDAGGAGSSKGLRRKLEHVNALSTELNGRVEAIAREQLGHGKLVGVLGGDHSTPFGLIAALAERHPGMGILHVDAHADLREAYEGFTDSHASIMFNVHMRLPGVAKIVQVGIRDFSEEEFALSQSSDRIETFYDQRLADRLFAGESWSAIARDVVERLPREVYVSFDIDGLDPSLCPNTGTPVPGGLGFREAVALLRAVVDSGRKIVGFDLNEVAGHGEWDANVGARLLYKLIGAAVRSNAAPLAHA